jgi:lysophospholipase L1-like esterase
MNTLRLGIMGFALTALMALTSCHSKSKTQSLPASVISRSHLGDGDYTPLQRVLAKARRGESITIGFIGGSITRGEGATSPDRQYADLVTRWWGDQFPKSKITLVNAGVAGTNSNYGCLRVQRDLISKHPDFVVVEFGVNDKDDLAHAETYEGVVRQLMMDPDHPAVLLLFLMHHDGTNAQDLQSEVGRQYHLPMISYRDALWPEIAAGRLKFSDITADAIHPNDRGHAAIATFIDSFLQDTLDHLPTDGVITPSSNVLPPPRFTDASSTRQI